MLEFKFKLKSKVWIYPGPTAWHFVTLPIIQAKKIKNLFFGHTKGFGSIPVTITVGQSCWKTSIFPDKKSNSYLLPLKAQVRKKEAISAGTEIKYELIFNIK